MKALGVIVMHRYVMIQKTDHMPLFSELFYNYGRNKVQWIEHLRYIGYKFGLLIQGFGVDVPHPPYVVSRRMIRVVLISKRSGRILVRRQTRFLSWMFITYVVERYFDS